MIDDLNWNKFVLRVEKGKVSEQLRHFIDAYNNQFEGDTKEDTEMEYKIRTDLAKVEKEYNQLKATLATIEAKNMAEATQREADQQELSRRLAKAKLNTIKEQFRTHFIRTPGS